MRTGQASVQARQKFFWRAQDLIPELVKTFQAGKPMQWPLVRKEKIHEVWSDFIATGGGKNEAALDAIFDSMSDSLCHLMVANWISGKTERDPLEVLGEHLDPAQHDAFCDWMLPDESGRWRVSDSGVPPLLDAMALAAEARTLGAKLKYLDRALHVTHFHDDLSRLFVEGGRQTVNDMAFESLESATTTDSDLEQSPQPMAVQPSCAAMPS